MFIVLLTFSDNKQQASEYMAGHNDWLAAGFDEGIFLLAGSLQPGRGGAIVAANTSMAELEARVAQDPFVEHNVVAAEILEISASRADERLKFLLG